MFPFSIAFFYKFKKMVSETFCLRSLWNLVTGFDFRLQRLLRDAVIVIYCTDVATSYDRYP